MEKKFTKVQPTQIRGSENIIVLNSFRGNVRMSADAPENIELISAFERVMLNNETSEILKHLEKLC